METDLPWFRELSADDRSWVGLIVQAGVKGFVDWYSHGSEPVPAGSALASAVFGAAPRALTGVITLQQTVDLVKLSLEVVESSIDDIIDPDDVVDVQAAVLRYAREVAFATAEVYARAAEVRGRLGRPARGTGRRLGAARRGRRGRDVPRQRPGLVGPRRRRRRAGQRPGPADRDRRLRRGTTRGARGRHGRPVRDPGRAAGGRAGAVGDAGKAAASVSDLFGEGPVVVGPVTDGLDHAHVSARAAMSAYRAASGWPEAPRPSTSAELLPERVLAGDGHARRHLVDEVYLPLLHARGTLIETLAAYFGTG